MKANEYTYIGQHAQQKKRRDEKRAHFHGGTQSPCTRSCPLGTPPHETDLTSAAVSKNRSERCGCCTPVPRCLPPPPLEAPAVLSVASPFALLLPLRLVKNQRLLRLDSKPKATQPTRPEQQSIGARARSLTSSPPHASSSPAPSPSSAASGLLPSPPPAEPRLPSAAATTRDDLPCS